eukprot:COSAG06_NODE_6878_length_2731_cov_2.525836_2_plen_172_part_00
MISGSSGYNNVDGTYSLAEAHCFSGSLADWAGLCDAGSPTTCGNAPVYQSGGAEGDVLYRFVSGGSSEWLVGPSIRLDDCLSHGFAYRNSKRGRTAPGAPDDGATYGGWNEDDEDSPMAIVPGGGESTPPPPPGPTYHPSPPSPPADHHCGAGTEYCAAMGFCAPVGSCGH